MMRLPYLRSAAVAGSSVVIVLFSFVIWSHFEFNDSFPNLKQFQIYSATAFLAIAAIIGVLLEYKARYWLSMLVLALSGFILFLVVGSYRYLVVGAYETWMGAVSGPSSFSSSLVINGGFLSLVAIISYSIAKLIMLIFQIGYDGEQLRD